MLLDGIRPQRLGIDLNVAVISRQEAYMHGAYRDTKGVNEPQYRILGVHGAFVGATAGCGKKLIVLFQSLVGVWHDVRRRFGKATIVRKPSNNS